ncbi:glycoside hydrolase family 1 protein [Tessaracoccus sp. G1721]
MSQISMPSTFLWGAATAGHQVDGGDVDSDTTFLENVTPTVFAEPAGVACGAWERWETDLDLAVGMGLNAFRFSIEWSRIEPRQGEIDEAAVAHYSAMLDGCLERGLAPLVTLSHFTLPHWFAARGGWFAADSAELFAGYCRLVTERLGERFALVVTLNEPNLQHVLADMLPAAVWELSAATLDAASATAGVSRYRSGNVAKLEEIAGLEDGFAAAHVAARAAVKAVRPDLPVGLSIAVADDVALPGGEAHRDAVRAACYGRWLELAKDDDFVGVQNYEQVRYDADGRLAPAPDAELNGMGSPISTESLEGAVRYVAEATGVPVLVTEHGLSTEDDAQRCRFLPEALAGLDRARADGVAVIGYCHWTFLDNFEWVSGYGPKFGLHAVDRDTLERTPKDSSQVYAAEIAARSAVSA